MDRRRRIQDAKDKKKQRKAAFWKEEEEKKRSNKSLCKIKFDGHDWNAMKYKRIIGDARFNIANWRTFDIKKYVKRWESEWVILLLESWKLYMKYFMLNNENMYNI